MTKMNHAARAKEDLGKPWKKAYEPKTLLDCRWVKVGGRWAVQGPAGLGKTGNVVSVKKRSGATSDVRLGHVICGDETFIGYPQTSVS